MHPVQSRGAAKKCRVPCSYTPYLRILPPFFSHGYTSIKCWCAMQSNKEPWILGTKTATASLPAPPGKRFAEVFASQGVTIEIYAPRGTDPQQPHDRDELYFVATGTAVFWDGSKRRPVTPGDAIFVPAWVPHRFEEFTDDFSVWVVFYGEKKPKARAKK